MIVGKKVLAKLRVGETVAVQFEQEHYDIIYSRIYHNIKYYVKIIGVGQEFTMRTKFRQKEIEIYRDK